MDVLLQARELSKDFGRFTALRSVGFDLARGEVVGFLGPNGAGKSTTMKILTGYLSPTSGSATMLGHDLVAEPLACRRCIGYLPEEVPLYLDMTVTAYLDHIARLKGVPRRERRREVVDAIAAAHLGENRDRHLKKLSKGNRQRAGLAQALIGNPPILILDEPTSGLDPTQVGHLRDLISQLRERHAILISTHILAEVEATCSRVVIIHRGRTVLNQDIESLHRLAGTVSRTRISVRNGDTRPLRQALVGATWARILEPAEGDLVVEAPAERRGDLVAAAEAHGGLRELVELGRGLEDIFRDLVDGGLGGDLPSGNAASTSSPS